MIKAIFFDTGDVIYREGFPRAVYRMEQRHRYPRGSLYRSCHDHQYWRDFTLGKITEQKYLHYVAKDFKSETGLRLNRREFKTGIRRDGRLIPGIRVLLHQLQRRYFLGTVSNHPAEWYFSLIRRFRIQQIFTIHAVSGMVHYRKPGIEIFKYALRQAGVHASESIYIDDRPDRIQGAKKLGMHVIAFRSVKQLKKDLSKITQ